MAFLQQTLLSGTVPSCTTAEKTLTFTTKLAGTRFAGSTEQVQPSMFIVPANWREPVAAMSSVVRGEQTYLVSLRTA
jgi:hypothetical protein